MTRELSKSFFNDLIDVNGLLYPILERVKKDDTLMLSIRDSYINIYYRGGNLLRIMEQNNTSYNTFFDTEYIKDGQLVPTFPKTIFTQIDSKSCVDVFAPLKEIMDFYLSQNNKSEREFQQLVARENNFSMISNESEYFISDIEFADTDIGARFDLLAIQWLADPSHLRKNGNNCRPALIEMKYGDNALGGSSGLIKHLKDIDLLISNNERYAELLSTMESQFNQLDELGLLKFNHAKIKTTVSLDIDKKPEVIFLLANHNPRSTILKDIINDPELDKYEGLFDLRFFVSSFAGYGLHSKSMISLSQFRDLIKGY